MTKVHIIASGGTIDKVYDPLQEAMLFDGSSAVDSLLASAGGRDCTFEIAFQLDSLEIGDQERVRLSQRVEACEFDRVVITHGTSRMVETARYLNGVFPEKTIVLTGALHPSRYRSEEAAFNLGGAVVAARVMPPGVYVVMQGRVLDGKRARKDPHTLEFIEVPQQS